MSEVTHEYPRAYKAATEVDPLILAQALDHIARTAAKSRSQTRRTRWIEQRALVALRGDEYRDIDLDLPKSAGPDTPEKVQRRMAYHIALKYELAGVVVEFLEAQDALDNREASGPNAEDYFVLLRRRNAARRDLDAAVAKAQEGAAS